MDCQEAFREALWEPAAAEAKDAQFPTKIANVPGPGGSPPLLNHDYGSIKHGFSLPDR